MLINFNGVIGTSDSVGVGAINGDRKVPDESPDSEAGS